MIYRKTVFDTPLVSSFFRGLCSLFLWVTGWKMKGTAPTAKKYILIGAPHTSNWDFIYVMSVIFKFRLKGYWMGKSQFFWPPVRPLLRWFGGIPIDRSKNHNTVEQMIEVFNESDELIVMVPPEGTRSKVERWRTGFYHIAVGAGVPIALGYGDYKEKTGGFLGVFEPTGDIEVDLPKIQAFYKDITPKFPEKF